MQKALLLVLLGVICRKGDAFPKENPELFEGDIILTPQQTPRNGIIGDHLRWPDSTVVYELDPNYTPEELEKIHEGWKEISTQTCIQFREKKEDELECLYIMRNETQCSSELGYNGRTQYMTLPPGRCLGNKIIIHEMLHTLGFLHEQNRVDRDEYVTIVWDNIIPGREGQFQKNEKDEVTHYGSPYDYESVMHYTSTHYAIDETMPTIIPVLPGIKIGESKHLSQLDAAKVRMMYNCTGTW